jgi:hypothetical protein
MKFSEQFGLGFDQSMLDFVDISLDADIPLFVDPYALSTRIDEWSATCAGAVNTFFHEVIQAIRGSDEARAMELLGHLHEPNETCLGWSSGNPSGRGVGGLQATHLYRALSQSTAVRTGFVEDLADCEIVVEGIGPDKISDITTNLIRSQLITYTQQQCAAHGIPIPGTVASGALWDQARRRWTQEYVHLPVVDGKKILLVPKFAVRWHVLLDHREYYRHFVLNFIQANVDAFGGLAHLARSRGGFVTKKDLEQEFPCGKDFLLAFSKEHPKVFQGYKSQKASSPPLDHEAFDENVDRAALGQYLTAQLTSIPSGRAGETRYHRLIAAILSFLFYPNLVSPSIEEPIHDGRKRIDITYINGSFSGLFRRFAQATGRPAPKIVAECKNYSNDVGNPEVDQVLGRFENNRGWLGLLLCRTVEDRATLEARCRDVARAHQAYIIPLEDRDIQTMLQLNGRLGARAVNEYLDSKFNPLTR